MNHGPPPSSAGVAVTPIARTSRAGLAEGATDCALAVVLPQSDSVRMLAARYRIAAPYRNGRWLS